MKTFNDFIENNLELVNSMKSCSYHYDKNHLNKHHLEENVFTHTKMSYLNTIKYNTSIYVKWAIILHDIGRVPTREENNKKMRVSFGDYEGMSIFMAIGILKQTKLSDNEKIRVLKIISYQYIVINHLLHGIPSKDKLLKMFKYDEELLKDLSEYARCDLLGRVVDESRIRLYNTKRIDTFIDYTKSIQNNVKKLEDKKNTLHILVGPPCSRKTTWINNQKLDAIIVSRDIYTEEIGRKYNKHTFNTANDLVEDNKKIKKERNKLELEKENYAKNSKNKNIIIDNPNLSKKYRKEWISAKHNTHKIVVILFLTPFDSLIECDKKRIIEIDKTVTKELFIEKLEAFEFPLLSEGIDEIECIFNENSFPVHDNQIKSTIEINTAKQSGELCQDCSLCCNGAMYTYITVSRFEAKKLPKLSIKMRDNKIRMDLPCPYLESGSCSVYTERPKRCRTYTCRLLDKVISGETSFVQAKQITSITKQQVSWLLSKIPDILHRPQYNEMNLRNYLYEIYELFSSRFKNNEHPVFTEAERNFCLNALDYFKGLAVNFHTSSLLLKYNDLVIKMN